MSQRQLRVERDSLLCVFLGNRIKLLPQEHTRGEEEARCRIGRHVEHASKRSARFGVVLSLDIGDAQNVGGIYVGARIPSLNSFQQWDGLGRAASEIVGESKELDCFIVTGI